MNILTVENLKKSYGEKKLFDGLYFGVEESDKIGVIGINGMGKSTFLKIIAGICECDEGRISKKNGLTISYLSQLPVFDSCDTIMDCIFKNGNELLNLVGEYEKTKSPELAVLMDKKQAWDIESRIKSVLTRLDINDFDKKTNVLSGGEKKRIALAAALVNQSDILILDEPTNHLDTQTISWLENYIKRYTGAIIMVTHDRYFLDRTVNKIVELDNAHLYTYTGNYSDFIKKKEERREQLKTEERKRQSFLKSELEWVRSGVKARGTKQKARLERFEKISEIKPFYEDKDAEILSVSKRLGKKIIEAENISISFGDKVIIDNFSYIVQKHDRIGIIGKNGSGKTTLLNILSKKINPDKGKVDIGETVKIGFFSQENIFYDESKRVIDYINDTAEFINTEDGKISSSKMLEKFLFNADMQFSPISKLSGGEKRRLYLLKVIMESPNVLFLDEPTNDLDIQTISIFEEYLDTFNGAVITVSHDRYFLDKCVDRIFSFESGCIKRYEGCYSDYIEKRENNLDNRKSVEKETDSKVWKKGPKKLKMTYQEMKDFENIDMVISELENEISEVETELIKQSSNYVKLQELTEKKEELEKKLNDAIDRWAYLNDLNEKINSLN